MTYDFRIYVLYKPYHGPPSPGLIREWFAYCVDPVPVPTIHSTFEFTHPTAWGTTKQEALQNLQDIIHEHLRNCNAEQGHMTVEA